jgi:hypothetical protein
MLTARFDDGFLYAHRLHQSQTRKGTSIPYISHLITVSALVIEHGGNGDQAIGALLHDAAKDQGGAETLVKIRATFGEAVSAIVADCTDAWTEPKPPWRARKETYLAALPHKPPASLLCRWQTRPTTPKRSCSSTAFLMTTCGIGSMAALTGPVGTMARSATSFPASCRAG